MMIYTDIELKKLQPNEGQIEGLPANPRCIDKTKFEQLKENIKNYPDLLQMRALIVYPHGDKFVIIGGNMRLKALKQLGYKTAPCFVVPGDTSADKMRAYTVLDNAPFGSWDWDCLANEWDAGELNDWGLDVPEWPADPEGVENEEQQKRFIVEIVCNDKQEQSAAFEKAEALGLICRMK